MTLATSARAIGREEIITANSKGRENSSLKDKMILLSFSQVIGMASRDLRHYEASSHLLKAWDPRALNFISKPLVVDLCLLKKQRVSNVSEYRILLSI